MVERVMPPKPLPSSQLPLDASTYVEKRSRPEDPLGRVVRRGGVRWRRRCCVLTS